MGNNGIVMIATMIGKINKCQEVEIYINQI